MLLSAFLTELCTEMEFIVFHHILWRSWLKV
uniref:Uncharacterized protein n=1 Tax=Rhizophora mucronata TaxID=61149 RepID=A0A2P2NC21_RHIMU